jgi:hypothetical protein
MPAEPVGMRDLSWDAMAGFDTLITVKQELEEDVRFP